MDNPLTHLYEFVVRHYDQEALRTLCFNLSVGYDTLPGEGPRTKASELLVHLGRQRRLEALVDSLRHAYREPFDANGLTTNPATLYAALPAFEAKLDAYTPLPPPAPADQPQPSPLPPGSRLPFQRSPLFMGRVATLQVLGYALLHEGVSIALLTQSIPDLGGMGKTQLGIELAYRYGCFFYGVHWLNATHPEGLAAEIAACGEMMSLPDWPEELPTQVEQTLEAWHQSGPRLVILDDLEDTKAARAWLDRLSGDSIRVLVTTRRWNWPEDLELRSLRLDVFEPQESRAFLRQLLDETQASDQDLDLLAQRLDHLPLALDLAARYLKRQGLPVADYVRKLQKVLDKGSIQNQQNEIGNPSDYELGLRAVLDLSWRSVADRAARQLFALAGYCAPHQPIPRELLQRTLQTTPSGGFGTRLSHFFDKSSHRINLEEALNCLIGLGLLQMEDRQAGPFITTWLAQRAQQRKIAGSLLPTLIDVLGHLGRQAREVGLPLPFAPLRPHVETVARAGQKVGLSQVRELWNQLGTDMLDQSDYPRAWATFEQALAIDEQTHGPTHPNVAESLNHLGDVLCHLGDLPGAQVVYQRALAIDEQTLDPRHPNVARDLNNLAKVLYTLGDLAGARTAYERALAIDEHIHGLYHPDVAQDVTHLGQVLYALGDLAGARAAYERALVIDQKVCGPDHPNVAIRLNNLGGVLKALGDFNGARDALEQALFILEMSLPPGHPSIQQVEWNLAGLGK